MEKKYLVKIEFKATVYAEDSETAQNKAYDRLPNLEPHFIVEGD